VSQRIRELAALHLTAAALAAALVFVVRANLFAAPAGSASRILSLLFVTLTAAGAWELEWARRSSRFDLVERFAAGLLLVTAPGCGALAGLTVQSSVATFLVGLGIVGGISGWSLRSVIAEMLNELSGTPPQKEAMIPTVSSTLPPPTVIPVEPANSAVRPVQSWTRSVIDGIEAIEAELQVVFAAGQRQVFVHLPIQPSLPATPEVECEPVDDCNLEIQVDLATPFGVRLQIRRSTVAGPLRAGIAVMMTSTACEAADAA
jgi:hypothetical protein